MKELFDKSSTKISRLVTRDYSTSFSIGVMLLGASIRDKIYSIYAFVRYADEIVDSFHDFDQKELLMRFIEDYENALRDKISLNPILNSFQKIVLDYELQSLVDEFLKSMKLDLVKSDYLSKEEYEDYIMGSAKVVGLMCLKIFVDGDKEKYESLKPYAMKLGSAFQKVNFLRDLSADYNELGRMYFPNVSFENFSEEDKKKIVQEIQSEFNEALIGIKKLPLNSRLGVYVAYKYYLGLLKRIRRKRVSKIMNQRIRISNYVKFYLLLKSYVRFKLNVL